MVISLVHGVTTHVSILIDVGNKSIKINDNLSIKLSDGKDSPIWKTSAEITVVTFSICASLGGNRIDKLCRIIEQLLRFPTIIREFILYGVSGKCTFDVPRTKFEKIRFRECRDLSLKIQNYPDRSLKDLTIKDTDFIELTISYKFLTSFRWSAGNPVEKISRTTVQEQIIEGIVLSSPSLETIGIDCTEALFDRLSYFLKTRSSKVDVFGKYSIYYSIGMSEEKLEVGLSSQGRYLPKIPLLPNRQYLVFSFHIDPSEKVLPANYKNFLMAYENRAHLKILDITIANYFSVWSLPMMIDLLQHCIKHKCLENLENIIVSYPPVFEVTFDETQIKTMVDFHEILLNKRFKLITQIEFKVTGPMEPTAIRQTLVILFCKDWILLPGTDPHIKCKRPTQKH